MAGRRRGAAQRHAALKQKLAVAGVSVLILLGATYVYASPYLTLHQVRRAAERNDAETVNAHVDFPALRQSVKGWIGSVTAKQMTRPETRDSPFAALGLAMVTAMSDRLVDAVLTPEMIRAMLAEGQRPTAPRRGGEPRERRSPPADIEIVRGYETPSRFVVTTRDRRHPRSDFSMVWERSGLVTWKLSALRFPSEL